MPGEITITATIVSFVLIAVILSGFIFLVQATFSLQKSLINTVAELYRPEKQALYITSAKELNASTTIINLSVMGIPLVPLSECEVIVKYTNNSTGEEDVNLLKYGVKPGWLVKGIYDGSAIRNISTGDYLFPGELAEIEVYLPSNASFNNPVIITFVSNTGSSAIYLIGGD